MLVWLVLRSRGDFHALCVGPHVGHLAVICCSLACGGLVSHCFQQADVGGVGRVGAIVCVVAWLGCACRGFLLLFASLSGAVRWI